MKKLFMIFFALMSLQTFSMAYADNPSANIKIRISGALSDNRYFLCIPNVGCLSILAAERGKVYPVFHPVNVRAIYVTNVSTFRVIPQRFPSSCNVTVDMNKTITISGNITHSNSRGVIINQLHCSVS